MEEQEYSQASEAPQGEAPVAPPEGAAPQPAPENSWDPKPWELKYNGQPVYPKDQNHLKMLAQKGWSYEQRMADLNRQQSEWQSQVEKYKRLEPYEKLDHAFRSNPEFARQIMELKERYEQGQTQQGEEDPRLQAIQQKLEKFESFHQTFEEQRATETLEKSKTELREKFKDFDWDSIDENGNTLMQRVMRHALETKMYDINRAFRDLMFDEVQLRASVQGKQQAANAVQQAHKAGIVETGRPTPPAPVKPFNPAGKTWNDVGQEATRELQQMLANKR